MRQWGSLLCRCVAVWRSPLGGAYPTDAAEYASTEIAGVVARCLVCGVVVRQNVADADRWWDWREDEARDFGGDGVVMGPLNGEYSAEVQFCFVDAPGEAFYVVAGLVDDGRGGGHCVRQCIGKEGEVNSGLGGGGGCAVGLDFAD